VRQSIKSSKLAGFRVNRRNALTSAAGGVGMLALKQLMAEDTASNHVRLSAPTTHHVPRAKSVILLFQNGGPSQMDLFDPKPELARQQGRPYPGKVEAHFDKQVRNLLASPFRFVPRGGCGMELSETLPHLGGIADDITLVRSMVTDSVDHEQALRVIHTGNPFAGKASWGSWVVYGLGTMREELPAYVVLTDPAGLPIDGTRNWSAGFLPAVYQGTQFRSQGSAVLNLSTPGDVSPLARRHQFDLLRQLNAEHLKGQPQDAELQARISNYELAARMQSAVPAVLDIGRETQLTRRLYGLDNPVTADYGKRCLMARRLVEQGVRFVSIYLQSQPWDTHSKNAQSLRGLCARTDQPAAALVTDLKRRGLLDSTIVVFAGEFGRLPVSQGPDGRDHNRHGFSVWLAGGGFKRGYVHGATDELGYQSVEDVVSVHDLHATLLHALGLDHRQLHFPHEGRDDSLTDEPVTGAEVADGLLETTSA
jgi:hypothetical protein